MAALRVCGQVLAWVATTLSIYRPRESYSPRVASTMWTLGKKSLKNEETASCFHIGLFCQAGTASYVKPTPVLSREFSFRQRPQVELANNFAVAELFVRFRLTPVFVKIHECPVVFLRCIHYLCRYTCASRIVSYFTVELIEIKKYMRWHRYFVI